MSRSNTPKDGTFEELPSVFLPGSPDSLQSSSRGPTPPPMSPINERDNFFRRRQKRREGYEEIYDLPPRGCPPKKNTSVAVVDEPQKEFNLPDVQNSVQRLRRTLSAKKRELAEQQENTDHTYSMDGPELTTPVDKHQPTTAVKRPKVAEVSTSKGGRATSRCKSVASTAASSTIGSSGAMYASTDTSSTIDLDIDGKERWTQSPNIESSQTPHLGLEPVVASSTASLTAAAQSTVSPRTAASNTVDLTVLGRELLPHPPQTSTHTRKVSRKSRHRTAESAAVDQDIGEVRPHRPNTRRPKTPSVMREQEVASSTLSIISSTTSTDGPVTANNSGVTVPGGQILPQPPTAMRPKTPYRRRNLRVVSVAAAPEIRPRAPTSGRPQTPQGCREGPRVVERRPSSRQPPRTNRPTPHIRQPMVQKHPIIIRQDRSNKIDLTYRPVPRIPPSVQFPNHTKEYMKIMGMEPNQVPPPQRQFVYPIPPPIGASHRDFSRSHYAPNSTYLRPQHTTDQEVELSRPAARLDQETVETEDIPTSRRNKSSDGTSSPADQWH